MTNTPYDEQIYLARVAEQCERHEDMCKFLNILKQKDKDLTNEERNLLSVGYKHVIGGRRNAYRAVHAISQNSKYSEHLSALDLQTAPQQTGTLAPIPPKRKPHRFAPRRNARASTRSVRSRLPFGSTVPFRLWC